MHIQLFENIKTHKSLLFATLGIALILILPISVATVTKNENPDDLKALPVYRNNPAVFTIHSLPRGTRSISLRTGDTLHAPLSTELTIDISHNPPFQTTLKKLLHEERKILIPMQKGTEGTVLIKISSASLQKEKTLFLRTQQDNENIPTYTLYTSKPAILALIQRLYAQNASADDIQYVWREGKAITAYNNPYKNAESSLRNGDKYSPYFPLSYIVSAGIQKVGFTSFEAWLSIVRPVVLMSQLIAALLVLLFLYKKGSLYVGVFGFFLILFHRFTLYPARVTHIDFPAIAFLLAGTMLLYKRQKTAYLLIGISLAIKQMAIFLVPLLLIMEWRTHRSIRNIVTASICMAIVPILSFLPFFVNNPQGTLRSIIFSAYRQSTGDFATPDIATMLSLEGLVARLPMLGMMSLVYVAAWKKQVRMFGATLAIFIVFIGFNPVLFFQYLTWIIPFIPLAISESAITKDTPDTSNPTCIPGG